MSGIRRTGQQRCTAYSIAYGHTQEHADALALGLRCLGPGFLAQVCTICKGHGEYQQTYTRGCGMGTMRSTGGCDYCGATGLTQGYAMGNNAAPDSVREQVLEAARRNMELLASVVAAGSPVKEMAL